MDELIDAKHRLARGRLDGRAHHVSLFGIWGNREEAGLQLELDLKGGRVGDEGCREGSGIRHGAGL